jgi:hypothetical protein
MERGMGMKGLRVSMKKTKLVVSVTGLDVLCDFGAFLLLHSDV